MPVQHVPSTKGPYIPRSFGTVKPTVIVTVYNDTVTGGMVFSGSLVESQTHAPSPTGGMTFSGTLIEAQTHASTPTGGIVFSGTDAVLTVFNDVVSGGIVFSGSLVESYVPGGAVSATQSRGPLLGVYYPN